VERTEQRSEKNTGRADLRIESIIAGPHGFQLADIFNTISLSRGDNVPVTIPDLYAANADRTLTSGGLLYSLVDLNIFLAHPPVIHFKL
jgi:hypothetical protein